MNNIAKSAELVLPERQPDSERLRVPGYLCRAALTFLCTYGLSVFLCDALTLGIARTKQLLLCLVVCAFFTVMGISRRFFLGGSIIGAGAAALWFTLTDKPLYVLFYAGVSIYNAWFRRLDVLGYNGMLRNVVDFDYALRQLFLTEEECRFIALTVIMIFLGAVAALCILRRARLLVLLFVGASLATLVLYFGLCTDNTGISLMIAALCGTVVLSAYDSVYNNRSQLSSMLGTIRRSADSRAELRHTMRVNSSLGGFAGIGAALIALLLIFIPSGFRRAMKDIPAISQPALKMENFMIAVVNGHNPDASGLLFSGIASVDSRTTEASARSYSGSQVFYVEANSDAPIYMRNWVGLDYYGDSWHTASYERIAEYRDIFGDDFSPEALTGELLYAIDPSLIALPENRTAVSHTEFGYITELIHIKKLTPSANILFLPSYTDHRMHLMRYGTREPQDISFTNYYDGIYTSTGYLFLDDYTVKANVPLLRDTAFAGNIGKLMGHFGAQYGKIEYMRKLRAEGANDRALQAVYNEFIEDPLTLVTSVYSLPRGTEALAYRYAYDMSDEERDQIDRLTDTLTSYYNYVYDNYLGTCEGIEEIGMLADSIVRAAGIAPRASIASYDGRHAITMAIIDYLSANMKYTLEPVWASEDIPYKNAAHTFLFDTNEGYCVQYATAAVMMLRSLGIPARYAEGYIVNEFYPLGRGSLGSCASTVVDSNAHAWVEVYYDYYGWVQYEATAPYYDGMYKAPDTTVSTRPVSKPSDTDYPEDTMEPEDTGDLTELPEKKADYTGLAVGMLIVAVIAGGIAVAVIFLRARAMRAERLRMQLLASVRARTLEAEERLKAASYIDDQIMRLLAHHKLKPDAGEQQREFAARVDEKFAGVFRRGFTDVSRAMMTGEFGCDIPHGELFILADFLEELTNFSLRSAGFFEAIWLKYFYIPS